jgi:holo-[acyl-carrier protein] synthase
MRLCNGIDLVSLTRFERALQRHGQRLLDRLFTPAEQKVCAGDVSSFAARFAAKEAVAKALGCGIGAISWQEIEVLRDEFGAPLLRLHGAARQRAQARGTPQAALSLSHDADCAIAQVILFGE